MDRLILMRHGKAQARAESGEDFDRELEPRGADDAAAMGRRLAQAGYVPDLALVSGAARTRQTWAAASEAFPQAPVRFEDLLYSADDEEVREMAEQAGEPGGTIMVVGHNPTLHELAIRLLAETQAPQVLVAQAHRNFPPGTAVVFAFDAAGRPAYEALFFPGG